MDLATQPPSEGLLTTADLAARADFTIGGVIVSPSTRALRGPGGSEDLEPRVMQVLVVLADSTGQVVTRDTLFNRCWGGVYVGDDSLNRAVAALRRAAASVGGRLQIETIPRTGYRLIVPHGAEGREGGSRSASFFHLSRRGALIGGGAAVAVGAGGLWWVVRSKDERRFRTLMDEAEAAVRKYAFDENTARIFESAVAIRPESAAAWGKLALVRSLIAQSAGPKGAPQAVEAAESAARRALALDPREPDALLAMFELQGSTLDWTTRDARLRQIIAIDPASTGAIAELVLLLQAAGMNRESWDWNERALHFEPLSVDFLGKRALKLWIAGRTPAADKVIDQVRALYPTNPWPWWIRFLILALTGRAAAAQAMLDANPGMMDSPAEAQFWSTSLAALDRPSPVAVASAREACIDSFRRLGFGSQAVMILAALGQVDTAFDISNGYLVSRGAITRKDQPGSTQTAEDALGRINTQWLFTPPCKVMRSDPRFLPLCEAVGLSEYWRRRGVRPDYQRLER